MLAADHQATEGLIRNAGLPFVFLRNGWYLENYTESLKPALQPGAILGCTGDGHRDVVYELGGDQPFTMAELAAEVSRQTGSQVVYRDLPAEEYVRALVAAGIPEPYAVALADSDRGNEWRLSERRREVAASPVFRTWSYMAVVSGQRGWVGSTPRRSSS